MRPPAECPSTRRKVHRGLRSFTARCRRRRRAAANDVLESWDGDAAAADDATDGLAVRDLTDASLPRAQPMRPGEKSGFLKIPSTLPSRPTETSGSSWTPSALRTELTDESDGGRGAVGPPCGAGANRNRVAFPSCDVFPIGVPAAAPKGDGPDPSANSPHGRGPGKSRDPTTPCAHTSFSLFHLNVRGLRDNDVFLDALLESLGFPHYVAVTETWLDNGTEDVKLAGYKRVSRLDRRNMIRTDRGGIALYARDGYDMSIVHVANSESDERSWHVIHSDIGPIAVCVWYRRPNHGEIESIQRFEKELQQHAQDCVATIAIGDMNVHNPSWLRWSGRDSPEGSELESICALNGLEQYVNGPTRGNNLLDLVLADFGSGLKVKITPGIHDNDHKGVLATVNVRVPETEPVRRKVYDFKKGNWVKLKRELAETDWGEFFANTGADEAAASLTRRVIEVVERHIPTRWHVDKAFAHPWLNAACREALRLKHAAEGTADFAAKRDECTRVFQEARRAYIDKVRVDLKKMSPSSRGWWKLSGSLLLKATGQENIPPLKRSDGSWAKSPTDKAAELASVFREKSVLPTLEENDYSALEPNVDTQMPAFLRIRVRSVKKILKELDETSGTGPDRLPARVLQRCHAELALPVTLLTRILLREGCWPQCWRTHWVQSIYKKGSKAEAKNYRGVHLTAQLSKVVERAVASLLVPWLEVRGAFGPHQYAYTKRRGYKDVLTINVCSWILAMERNELVGLYCSDVSGAFDRVSHRRMGDKLARLGLNPGLLSFLQSWLQDRVSEVVVGGRSAGAEPLCDSVFQGTVLGSPLRNVFYADARESVRSLGFEETVFADDFNCWRTFKKDKVPANLRGEIALRGAQKELHLWGKANQVLFDPSKESFHLLHRALCAGGDFKILGVLFDQQLLMHAACRSVATEAGWRLQKLLKSRRYFTTPELVHLYKAQVLSFIESSTPGLYHAAASVLDRVDRVQRRFLREVGLNERTALCDFRLAPLPSRRDMAMLGVLQKVALGIAPIQLAALFPLRGSVAEHRYAHRMRHWRPLHSRQLHSHVTFNTSETMRRSLFGLVNCYNLLPQKAVGFHQVKSFQRSLQNALKTLALRNNDANWCKLFSSGWRALSRTELDTLFM